VEKKQVTGKARLMRYHPFNPRYQPASQRDNILIQDENLEKCDRRPACRLPRADLPGMREGDKKRKVVETLAIQPARELIGNDKRDDYLAGDHLGILEKADDSRFQNIRASNIKVTKFGTIGHPLEQVEEFYWRAAGNGIKSSRYPSLTGSKALSAV